MGTVTARIKTVGHGGPLVLKVEMMGSGKDLEAYIAANKNVGSDCYIWHFDN